LGSAPRLPHHSEEIAATVQNYAPDRPTRLFFHKMLVALKRADFTRRLGSDWLQQQKRNHMQNLKSKLQHQSMQNYAADRPTCVFFQSKNYTAEHSKKSMQKCAPDRPTRVFFHKMLVALKRADFTRRLGGDWLQQQKLHKPAASARHQVPSTTLHPRRLRCCLQRQRLDLASRRTEN